VFVCVGGLGLASEGGPSHFACFVVDPFAAPPARWCYKLYVMFIYDIVVLRLQRCVTGVCGCVK
jgi:hypothetical protein